MRCAANCDPPTWCWSRGRAAAGWIGLWTRWCRTRRSSMLLELAQWLQTLDRFFAVFGYITLRAILSALTALALSLWLGPHVIGRLRRLKVGQPICSDGPQSHLSKAGTPDR